MKNGISNFKLISIAFLLLGISLLLGATTGGIKKNDNSGNMIKKPVIYYHVTEDFNDANNCMAADVYLKFLTYTIDTNGTDTSLQILILIDPPEANSTTISKLYTYATIEVNSVECPVAGKVIQSRDPNDNPYGGLPMCGDIYIGRRNISGLTDLKVYLNLDSD